MLPDSGPRGYIILYIYMPVTDVAWTPPPRGDISLDGCGHLVLQLCKPVQLSLLRSHRLAVSI